MFPYLVILRTWALRLRTNSVLMNTLKNCKKTNSKLKTLFNAFFNTQFNYCPLKWIHHSRCNNIKSLHEKYLQLICKDECSSYEELLQKDGSVSIHHKNIQELAIEMLNYLVFSKSMDCFLFNMGFLHERVKVKKDLAPQIVKDIFMESSENHYNLCNQSNFRRHISKKLRYSRETKRSKVYRQKKSIRNYRANIYLFSEILCS